MNIGLYLRCDDNLDTDVVLDSSPNSNHATMHATIEGEDPPDNYEDTSFNHDADTAVGTGALTLLDIFIDAADTLIQIPDAASNRMGVGDCSLSFRIKGSRNKIANNDRVFYKGTDFDIYVGLQEPTRFAVRFGISDDYFSIDYADVFAATDAVWHHVVVTREAATSKIRMYLDAVLQTDITSGLTYVTGTISDISYSGADIFVGAKNAGFENKPSIVIDDILLVDTVLTATQVGYLFDSRSDIIAMASETQPVPVISSVTDNNDGSITLAVTGDDTIQLYYRLLGASAWTTGESRSGDGDIVHTGLTLNKWYELYCVSVGDYHTSAPTAIEKIFIDNGEYNDIETAIYSVLTGDDSVNALVAARVYPQVMDEGAVLPAIVYHHLNTGREWVLDGPVNLTEPRFQVNCFAATYYQARDLANKVRLVLNGYSGTANGVKIWGIEIENEGDLLFESASATGLRRYGKRVDIRIHFRESQE